MRTFDRLGFEQCNEHFGVEAQHACRLRRAYRRKAPRLAEQESRPTKHAASTQPLQRLARAGLRLERVLDLAPRDDENVVGRISGGVNSLAGSELRRSRDRRDTLQKPLGRILERCGFAQRGHDVLKPLPFRVV